MVPLPREDYGRRKVELEDTVNRTSLSQIIENPARDREDARVGEQEN